MGRTPYDVFMLRFHDFLKENSRFQAGCPKVRLEFPPTRHLDRLYRRRGARRHVRPVRAGTNISYSRGRARFPEEAPYRILENIAGHPLVH